MYSPVEPAIFRSAPISRTSLPKYLPLCLVAIMIVASQMMRSEIESADKGQIAGWTLAGLNQMSTELQNASYLATPTVQKPTGHVISGCINYSGVAGATLNPQSSVTAFYYCVYPPSGSSLNQCGQSGVVCNLLRYANSSVNGTCPISPTPTCGQGSYGVVAQNVSKISATPYFTRDDNIGGVDLSFNVGTTGTAVNRPNPVYLAVSTKIKMNKAYGSGD